MRVVLGCGNFGGIGSAPAFFGQGETREQAFELMDAAWALGLRRFDTADAYGGGRSETWIGDWIRATGQPAADHLEDLQRDGGRRRLRARPRTRRCGRWRRAWSGSAIERIDLYLTHEPDPDTPVEETFATFAGARSSAS